MNRVFVIGRDCVPEKVSLSEGESLRWTIVIGPEAPKQARIKTQIDIEGPGCEVDIAGVYISENDIKAQLDVLVRHLSGGSTSRQLFKGVVSDTAQVDFNGLIYVAPDAQKTKAYQENHTILLSEGARVQTRPQLEIYADDVECSHGATTGYLNPDELFYMRSRGIPEDQAKRLQILSFLSPVLSRLPEEEKQKLLPEE